MTYKLDVRGPLMSDIQRHVWRQRELSLSPTNRKLIQILIVLWLLLGTLSKDDDDGSENVAKKMNLRSTWTLSICQMQATFPGVEFLRILFKFKKRKENSSCHVHVLHKTAN